jgi:hypothetical protein
MKPYVIGGETAEPANKRARLESVIPVRSTPTQAAKPAQPAPAQPPKPVPPPLWLSGQLPNNQRGNTHTRGQQREGARRPAAKGRPARAGPDGPTQGRQKGRAPRRPTRPLGPLVKVEQESAKRKYKKVNHLEN